MDPLFAPMAVRMPPRVPLLMLLRSTTAVVAPGERTRGAVTAMKPHSGRSESKLFLCLLEAFGADAVAELCLGVLGDV